MSSLVFLLAALCWWALKITSLETEAWSDGLDGGLPALGAVSFARTVMYLGSRNKPMKNSSHKSKRTISAAGRMAAKLYSQKLSHLMNRISLSGLCINIVIKFFNNVNIVNFSSTGLIMFY